MIRENNLNSILYEKGDIVNLPFNETGIIVHINTNILWGFKYKVKIIKSTLNKVNDIIEYKAEQFN